ncbi:unnamed protein product [Rotaria socialis]|uniref:G-protein coupled receptors family 1 profile domain-containing protein n=5 Tax=Rotaria socialis TaxID=392032 RepID=A0A818QYM6_9BILA|nr:unnamed protein product [Rotaria socialis]CAF3304621.1 unnamed protein product [Rotaria socialis]CAF3648974.1 unnamed protein product [Rotaria socialis]CAF3747818.1 unnamed protein product [Rotaria socialis]CAF4535086.1 unnamed protein product [Rotaria socialis]
MSPSSSPTPLSLISENQSNIDSTSTAIHRMIYNISEMLASSNMNDSPQTDDVFHTNSLIRYRLLYRNYHGFISSAVCIFGLTCNLFNIIVLTRPLMRSSTNTILTSLALSDLLKMLFVLPAVILFYCLPKDDMKSEPDPTSYVQVKFYMIQMLFTLTLHCISTWLTVYLAAFRYVFLNCKALTAYVSSPDRALIGVAVVVLLSTILCVPSYLEHQIVHYYVNNTQIASNKSDKIIIYRFDQTAFSKSLALRDKVFVLHGVIFKLIPCMLLLLFSFLLVQQLRSALKQSQHVHRTSTANISKEKRKGRLHGRKREKENRRTTLMLVIVCALFLVTELPQGAILFLTFLSKHNSNYYFQIYQHLGDTFDILALINNSVNFILYCLMSKAFRDTFQQTFCFIQKFAPHQPTVSFSKLTTTKRQQKYLNEAITYEAIPSYRPSQNGRLHEIPIRKSFSDNEPKKIKRTLKSLEFFSHNKSASL